MKKLKRLKSQNGEPNYLFMTGSGGSRERDLIKTIYHSVVKTYRHDAPINPEKLAASTGGAALTIDGTTMKTVLAIPKNTADVLPAIRV